MQLHPKWITIAWPFSLETITAMSMDVQTSMRLPAEMLQRADDLIESLQQDPTLSMMGKMTRSKVLRLALSEGLKSLEQQHRFRNPSPTLRPRSSLVGTDAQTDRSSSAPTMSTQSQHQQTQYLAVPWQWRRRLSSQIW